MTYDLTGVTPSWPPDLEAVWASCVADAAGAPGAWHGPASRGDPELLKALGDLLRVAPDRIVVTSGVRACAVAMGRGQFLGPAGEADLAQFPGSSESQGIRVRCAAWPTLAALSQASPGTVWVTSPARNPDGAAIEAGLAASLRDSAAARGDFMVVNETYAWYADCTAPAGCVRVGSLSKLAGGGARLGWVIDPPAKAARALGRLGPPTTWQRAWARFDKCDRSRTADR